MKRIHDGEIGDITSGRAYWNQGVLWFKPHQKDQTEVQYQMRNWYNFPWLCGDHIVEQHIHNLDVMNWAIDGHPIRAIGMGGRQRSVPNPEDYGVIFDHFAMDYEYPNGVHVLSMCRQIDGCDQRRLRGVRGHEGPRGTPAATGSTARASSPRSRTRRRRTRTSRNTPT